MNKILAVALREFKHTALTKAFIIGTIIFPLIIWGGMVLVPLLIKPTVSDVNGTLALIDPTGHVVDAAEIEFDPAHLYGAANRQSLNDLADIGDLANAGDMDAAEIMRQAEAAPNPFGSSVRLNIKIESHTDIAALDSLHERIRSGDLLAVAAIDPAALEGDSNEGVTLYVATASNPDRITAVRRTLSRAVVRARTEKAGLNVDEMQALLKAPTMVTRRLTDVGEAAAGLELQKMLPIFFMVLLWIGSFASGNYLLTTTIEEKSNKVMEVLLSAVSPLQLMSGKILGQAIVGLFTISVYGALGIAALSAFAMADLIQVRMIVYLIVYFFMAYFMVAAIMAAIGSAVSDLQEAHALITPAMLILFIPMLLFMPVTQSPNGTLAIVTSYIPILTPFVMIIRVTASEPIALWEIIASMVVGYVGVALMVWMASRIFRIGVLMYGKPPSPLELIKWLRYA